ncbi:MAG TPA: hypothetical protein VGP36_00580 [Mycobacteriales bacterium]|jgi:hypothetical protein|nr:hypothetical protein [Mycobacteriales bacterium]
MDSTTARRAAAADRLGRLRAAALLTAVPIAFTVGAAVATPFGALGSARPLDSGPHLTAQTSMFADCHGARPQATLAAEVTVSAVGSLKWPDCAGD